MERCVIFCAGDFTELPGPIRETDCVIAADGGLAHLQRLGIRPRIILGDFDSLGYVPGDGQVFPVEKDDTDAMLAVRKGLQLGYRSFLLYGAMDGPRPDHTVANYQLLCFLARHGAHGYLVGSTHTATVVSGEQVCFPDTAAGILSAFCMGPEATGVTLSGLQYPLTDGTLSPDFPLGVSNHFIGENAAVTVKNGSVLLIYDRENGFPTRKHLEVSV